MGHLAKFIANPLVLILVITAGGVVLTGRFWSTYRDSLLSDPRFRLETAQIQVTEPPEWLTPEAHRDWIQSQAWGGQSLLRPTLVTEVAQQLRQDPWIDEVLEVRKMPQGLRIDVRYGRPLLVELPEGKILPVNSRGRVMETLGLSAESTASLLRIAVPDLIGSPLKIGEPWPDTRVVKAAELGRQLANLPDATQIAGIYAHHWPVPAPGAGRRLEREIEFRLWTAGRNEIIWGSPLGQELTDEAGWESKLNGLADFIRRNGSIDRWSALPAQRSNVLDLRSGTLVLLKNAKLALENSFDYR